jgi:hypothetical protein
MSEKYRIYRLDLNQRIPNKRSPDGVLRKDWYSHSELGECLLKEARSPEWDIADNRNTRTDWTEKVVYEIAKLINVPTARCELAVGYFDDSSELTEGIVSINCIPTINTGVLTGENILIKNISGYKSNDISQYTVENILYALELSEVNPPSNWENPITEIDSGAKLFIGYLMIDALTINRDRHYHNWGVMSVGNQIELIPSFDHGLSLGGTDKINLSVERYASRYKSPFQGNNQQLSTFSVFDRAAKLYPDAAIIWLEQLSIVTSAQINEIFDRIPEERITPAAARFAIDLLEFNRQELLLLYDKYLVESTGKYEERVQANLASLKAGITEYSDNLQLNFSENTLSFLEEFVRDRLKKAGYPNPQNVVVDPPVSEFDTKLKQRLFKQVEENILELENSDNLWMLEAEIRQEMIEESLANPQIDKNSVDLITVLADEENVDEEGEDIGWHI